MDKEISAETRLLLIELAEGFADSVRKGTMVLSEGNGRALAQWADAVMHPERQLGEGMDHWKNITEACDMIGITPQTFRKYVRLGTIAKGTKKRGYHEPVWRKEEIDQFKKWYVSQRRKV